MQLKAKQVRNPYRRLVYNGLFGNNIDTICVITTEVMQPRGLVGMGQDTLDVSGSQIAQVPFLPPLSIDSGGRLLTSFAALP